MLLSSLECLPTCIFSTEGKQTNNVKEYCTVSAALVRFTEHTTQLVTLVLFATLLVGITIFLYNQF
jgi:hypothetical protein